MTNQEPSEQDWERAADKVLALDSVWSNIDLGPDRRQLTLSTDKYIVTREQALAEMRRRTEITVSGADLTRVAKLLANRNGYATWEKIASEVFDLLKQQGTESEAAS